MRVLSSIVPDPDSDALSFAEAGRRSLPDLASVLIRVSVPGWSWFFWRFGFQYRASFSQLVEPPVVLAVADSGQVAGMAFDRQSVPALLWVTGPISAHI